MTMPAAIAYVTAGLSVIPIRRDGSKAAGVPWAVYQQRLATQSELRGWFSEDEYGIAIIGGRVSGNIEVEDVDDPEILNPWFSAVMRAVPQVTTAPRVRSPKGGGHLYVRSEAQVAGNRKLAQRDVADLTKPTGTRRATLIETKGEGGYVLAPGSPADCHPSGRPYVLMHGSFDSIPVLTTAELEKIHEIGRSFDERPKEEQRKGLRQRDGRDGGDGRPQTFIQGDRPGDEFSLHVTWAEILEPHSWVAVYTDSAGITHWRRPEKHDSGTSATTGYGDGDYLYVFSSNAHPFEPQRGYSKFSAYALLEHDGDFPSAAKALAKRGFGKQIERRGELRVAYVKPSIVVAQLRNLAQGTPR
jgi:putative DNA primase/helicase